MLVCRFVVFELLMYLCMLMCSLLNFVRIFLHIPSKRAHYEKLSPNFSVIRAHPILILVGSTQSFWPRACLSQLLD
ncbi:MAG: hypothetical protein ACI8RD_000772 [Bacillariaceae sp.]|jgi:hypothetical protein